MLDGFAYEQLSPEFMASMMQHGGGALYHHPRETRTLGTNEAEWFHFIYDVDAMYMGR